MKIPMMAIAASALALPAAPALAAELPIESRTSTVAASPFSATPASENQYQRRDYRDRREYRRGYRDARREARQERRLDRGDRVWRGQDGRYRCRRSDGSTGLVIGAGVGALAGSQIAADSTLGAIIGAIGGGLLGREIDRGDLRCR
ncbi:glycine zipper 2TM domain-containing protein [Erythrobacter sp. YJ-T3-07]|uniref:glycine zipper 2TM domain-containing protein n=1 Tax=Erythrobacter sp. YJ-T3-07 TaxID=2793063 RepID=UPI0018D4493A|nr:glycine zipper 2TM domain-containing protein [Erythrobacter sp. YJ-T3-07]MBH1943619.1 glycine zipper 2TM domain-containing protein [Erythrobacter sp. YJ-T3-07]